MSIESTTEYKQDRINVRNINAIILTGRCYKYKDNYYEKLDFIKVKNVKTGNWETFVRYKSVLEKEQYGRDIDDFNSKFEHITEQLL